MKRHIALAALLPLALCCSATPKMTWERADGAGDSQAIRDRRAKDLADCVTMVGAPTQGVQSTASPSREQVKDCMRSKGWRQVPASEP